MKVLKAGRPQKGWSMKFVCTGAGNGGGGCEAKLLVEQGDVFLTESHARDETTVYHTFRCPECGVNTDIQSSDRPRGVPSHVNYPTGVRHKNGGWTHPLDHDGRAEKFVDGRR